MLKKATVQFISGKAKLNQAFGYLNNKKLLNFIFTIVKASTLIFINYDKMHPAMSNCNYIQDSL